jgi:hypothetical protein
MPSDAEARRQAAVDDVEEAVSGIARALHRIAQHPMARRDRRMVCVVSDELARIRRAARVLRET